MDALITPRPVTLADPAHFSCGNRTTRPDDYGSVFMGRTAGDGRSFWFDRIEMNFACNFPKGHGPQSLGEDLRYYGRVFRVKDWTDNAKRGDAAIRPRNTL